jgi:hypothetical protein
MQPDSIIQSVLNIIILLLISWSGWADIKKKKKKPLSLFLPQLAVPNDAFEIWI